MANHDVNLATKSSKFKFKSLDECLNNLYTMRTYLKGQHNNNKRQRSEPTKLVPISFVELKLKREKNICPSKRFSTQVPAQRRSTKQLLSIWKKMLQKVRCFLLQREFFQPMANAG